MDENQHQQLINDAQSMSFEQLKQKYNTPKEEIEQMLITLHEQGWKPEASAIQPIRPPPQPSKGSAMIDQVKSQIIKTLMEDENSRRDLYEYVKRESGFDVAPYMDGILKTKTMPKFKSIEKENAPAVEIAQLVIKMWDDGYTLDQIAYQNRFRKKEMFEFIQNRKHWESLIGKKVLASPEVQALPWYIRAGMKLKSLWPW